MAFLHPIAAGAYWSRCLFSQEANSQKHISEDTTEKTMAWTTAGCCSETGGYESHEQLREQFFRLAGRYFTNLPSSVGSTSEEIYPRYALYASYTSGQIELR